ncbi:Uncharacterised protein [Yersinia enterocolitica]|nr:Uncharacterised protein [Yersinia enterocolitica]
MAIEVIFHHDNTVCIALSQRLQCLIQRAAANHGQADAVSRAGDESNTDVRTSAFQSFRHISCGFNDGIAARTAAGDNQWFLRAGQCLHDDVHFAF